MLLLAGLGNTGESYKLTRHNLGFIVLDNLASFLNIESWNNKFKSHVCETTFQSSKLLLLKPQTFMNLSGEAILSVQAFYKIIPENIIVIYDDIDLPLGKVRYKINSSSGGHNGIKNIQTHIGNNFHRIKCGTGKPLPNQPLNNYVLSNFNKQELTNYITPLIQRFINNIDLLINKNFKSFVENINKENI